MRGVMGNDSAALRTPLNGNTLCGKETSSIISTTWSSVN